METRAKFVTIGIFIVGTAAVLFGFLYWLGVTSETASRLDVRVVFPGPVTGLRTGGQVHFNGIRVGEVGQISFDPADPKRVVAIASVDPSTPIKTDTKVELGVSILSRIAQIEFTGGTSGSPSVFDTQGIPTLYAGSSAIEDIVRGSQQLISRADRLLSDLDTVLEQNAEGISRTVANVAKFTDAIAENSDGVSLFMDQLSGAAGAFTGLASKLSTLIETTDSLVNAINPEGIEEVMGNVNTLALEFVDSTRLVNELIISASTTANEINSITSQFSKTLKDFDNLLTDIDPKGISKTFNNIEKITGVIADKSDDLSNIVDNTRDFIANANSISNTINTEMSEIQSFIDEFGEVIGGMNKTITQLDKLVQVMDVEEFNKFVTDTGNIVGNASEIFSTVAAGREDITATIANAREASASLSRFAETLSGQKESINRIVADTSAFAGQLGEAGEQVSGILKRIDGMVEADGDGLIIEASKAAESIANIAAVFEKQAVPISENLVRFSESGLQNLTVLLEEATRTLNSLNRAITNFDRDPNRIIFGASDVPVYQGNP